MKSQKEENPSENREHEIRRMTCLNVQMLLPVQIVILICTCRYKKIFKQTCQKPLSDVT